MVQVQITTPLRPTEREERVVAAATAFFPDGDARVADGEVTVRATGLDALRQRIWELRIIDTVRGALLAGAAGGALHFTLSKQAALRGRVSLPAAPHSLGDLQVRVAVEDVDPWPDAEALAWWLCPQTKDGHIVGDDAATTD